MRFKYISKFKSKVWLWDYLCLCPFITISYTKSIGTFYSDKHLSFINFTLLLKNLYDFKKGLFLIVYWRLLHFSERVNQFERNKWGIVSSNNLVTAPPKRMLKLPRGKNYRTLNRLRRSWKGDILWGKVRSVMNLKRKCSSALRNECFSESIMFFVFVFIELIHFLQFTIIWE